jgi:hypothetical protein
VKRYYRRLGYTESKQLVVVWVTALRSAYTHITRNEIFISRLTSGNAITSSQLSLFLQLWRFWNAMKEGKLTAEKSARRFIKQEWRGVLYSGVLKFFNKLF